MEVLEKMQELNITEDISNENIIGKVRDIQELFLFMIKQDIDNKELDIEEVLGHIEDITDFIKDLYKSGYDYETKIKVWYNPMGAYSFELYEEEE